MPSESRRAVEREQDRNEIGVRFVASAVGRSVSELISCLFITSVPPGGILDPLWHPPDLVQKPLVAKSLPVQPVSAGSTPLWAHGACHPFVVGLL